MASSSIGIGLARLLFGIEFDGQPPLGIKQINASIEIPHTECPATSGFEIASGFPAICQTEAPKAQCGRADIGRRVEHPLEQGRKPAHNLYGFATISCTMPLVDPIGGRPKRVWPREESISSVLQRLPDIRTCRPSDAQSPEPADAVQEMSEKWMPRVKTEARPRQPCRPLSAWHACPNKSQQTWCKEGHVSDEKRAEIPIGDVNPHPAATKDASLSPRNPIPIYTGMRLAQSDRSLNKPIRHAMPKRK